jgi:hypothetical protein
MAIRLNKEEIDAIARRVLELMRENNHVIIEDADGDEWVTVEEAAAILNLSKGRIYQIKNHLTHRKGNSRQSRVYFLKSRLFEDYMNI